MKRHLANRNGFTLIELLVAICLLTIGIFAVISMQVTAIKSNSIGNRISTATALAQEAMDDITSWNGTDTTNNLNNSITAAQYNLKGNNNGHETATGPNASNEVTIPGSGTFSATYTTQVNAPVAGLTQIVVTVTQVVNGVPDPNTAVSISSVKRIT